MGVVASVLLVILEKSGLAKNRIEKELAVSLIRLLFSLVLQRVSMSLFNRISAKKSFY